MNDGAAGLAIRLDGVCFSYPRHRRRPERPALVDVSLDVPVNQFVALLGPNGSGKSTLLSVLSGTLRPSQGRATVLDSTEPGRFRRSLGVVFQTAGLDPYLRVIENLRCQAALYGLRGRTARERIDETLAAAELSDRRDDLVKTLSLGLSRRVDLCRALLARPELLLLDEPTAGLDPVARERFLGLLEERARGGRLTVVMSTHLVDEADRFDRVVLMHRGRVIADDAPSRLRATIGDRVVQVLGTDPPPAFDGIRWDASRSGWAGRLADGSASATEIAAALAAGGRSFSIHPPTLADVFEQMTGSSLRPGESPRSAVEGESR